jgi:methionyl-tRNA synthetase
MKYYLTTPIYYVNAAPHIGHAYTTIVADLLKRFKGMQGYQAVLTTGSDEHGVNVERAAERAGKTPKEFCDVIAAEFARQWQMLGLGIDYFQRTTSPQHARVVNDLFDRCRKNGYIYKGSYTGQYCIFDNLYVNDAKPGDPCPDCGRPTETITEENFFFKLSAFQDRLLELYDSQPDFIQPETRRNEVISFVRSSLTDLSITRTNIKWGIPVEGEAPHVFYVWFDALTAYMSAVVERFVDDKPVWRTIGGEPLWPADLHLIGKEIVRFHAVYWPAFIMAAYPNYNVDRILPDCIFAHGWLLFEIARQHRALRTDSEGDGRRRAALFPAARGGLRAGWQLQLRCVDWPLQFGPRQRPGQPGQPHADHDSSVPEGRGAACRERRHRECGPRYDQRGPRKVP